MHTSRAQDIQLRQRSLFCGPWPA